MVSDVHTTATANVAASGMQRRVICLTGNNFSKTLPSICDVEEGEVREFCTEDEGRR